eukprot:g5471.t1
MNKFNESLSFDKRMWKQDIEGSQAYARALHKAKILTSTELDSIVNGLEQVGEEWIRNEFEVSGNDEDIHSANERRLTELIGPIGGKLHTGRSRNDQVATDTRLWLMSEINEIRHELQHLVIVFCNRAESEIEVLMPGFTHLQSAQCVRWSHWLMSHASALHRDDERLKDSISRISRLPLGSGALSGNPFSIDRRSLAGDLGFHHGLCPNSMDAVSDRDYLIEFVFNCTMLMTHLSRWSEDLIVYSSAMFKFIQCSDAYTTGSSLMPQKKNPDGLELIRGKTGYLQGSLMSLMAIVKGLPTTYNKDLQECWPIMFSTVDTVKDCLKISTGILSTLRIFPEQMLKGLSMDMLATDLAEYLVRKGVPFRETHEISGKAVRLAEERNCSLGELTLSELQTLHHAFTEDVHEVWNFERSVEMKSTEGGTSRKTVLLQIEQMRDYIHKSS